MTLSEKKELRRPPSNDTDNENKLMVGHVITAGSIRNTTGSWHLGNIMLFRGVF